MAVLLLFFGAIGAGLLLIFLIAVTAPRPPPVDLKRESNDSPLITLDSEQLGKVVAELLDKMGLEIDRLQGGKNEVIEIHVLDEDTYQRVDGSVVLPGIALEPIHDALLAASASDAIK